ncbi:hypothetical protein [Verminephrobacter aporrectodeae]|nr:hypothetical protein [Verminephrobacter aporrectodeae]
MVEIIKTDLFDRWLVGLRDRQARAKIDVRITSIEPWGTRATQGR